MPGYRYRITVEPIADRKGEPIDKAPISFEVENHDEILSIVERLGAWALAMICHLPAINLRLLL